MAKKTKKQRQRPGQGLKPVHRMMMECIELDAPLHGVLSIDEMQHLVRPAPDIIFYWKDGRIEYLTFDTGKQKWRGELANDQP